eukprot:1216004-Rhodomonas_salina.1
MASADTVTAYEPTPGREGFPNRGLCDAAQQLKASHIHTVQRRLTENGVHGGFSFAPPPLRCHFRVPKRGASNQTGGA